LHFAAVFNRGLLIFAAMNVKSRKEEGPEVASSKSCWKVGDRGFDLLSFLKVGILVLYPKHKSRI
jgi:hypothetical protein